MLISLAWYGNKNIHVFALLLSLYCHILLFVYLCMLKTSDIVNVSLLHVFHIRDRIALFSSLPKALMLSDDHRKQISLLWWVIFFVKSNLTSQKFSYEKSIFEYTWYDTMMWIFFVCTMISTLLLGDLGSKVTTIEAQENMILDVVCAWWWL